MKALLLILIAAAHAQTPKTTTHTVKFTAGSISCTFERREPPALTGLHMDCASGTSSMKQDAVGSGLSGQFGAGQDTLKWTFQRPTESGAFLYKIVANDKTEQGSL